MWPSIDKEPSGLLWSLVDSVYHTDLVTDLTSVLFVVRASRLPSGTKQSRKVSQGMP